MRKMIKLGKMYNEDTGETQKMWFYLDEVAGMSQVIPDPEEEEEFEHEDLPVRLVLKDPKDSECEPEVYYISEDSADHIYKEALFYSSSS